MAKLEKIVVTVWVQDLALVAMPTYLVLDKQQRVVGIDWTLSAEECRQAKFGTHLGAIRHVWRAIRAEGGIFGAGNNGFYPTRMVLKIDAQPIWKEAGDD